MQSLREGLFYVWHMPTVLLVIGVVGMIALFGINFNVMLPLFATDVFDAGPVGYGFISAAYGLGALFSALWIAFALSHFYTLSFPLLISLGCAQIVMAATANTTIQMVTPNSLRGRAISVYLLVYTGGMPLENLLAGGLTTLFGAPSAFLLGGIPCFVAAIVGWILRKPAEKSLVASTTAMRIE